MKKSYNLPSIKETTDPEEKKNKIELKTDRDSKKKDGDAGGRMEGEDEEKDAKKDEGTKDKKRDEEVKDVKRDKGTKEKKQDKNVKEKKNDEGTKDRKRDRSTKDKDKDVKDKKNKGRKDKKRDKEGKNKKRDEELKDTRNDKDAGDVGMIKIPEDVKDLRRDEDMGTGGGMRSYEGVKDVRRDEDSKDGGAIETFEDLMELVGTRGRWNIGVIVLCAFCTFTTPFSSLTYQFLGWTPDYWCEVPELMEANWTQEEIITLATPVDNITGKKEGCLMHNYNYTLASLLGYEETMANVSAIKYNNNDTLLSCPSRIYNTSQHHYSIVIEWDLTCERRALYSTTQAMTQVGTMIASIIYGYVFDLIGRRKGVLVSVVLSIVTAAATTAATSIEAYLVLRLLFQTADFGYYMGCFVIAMELCSPSQRNHVCGLYILPWTLGYMMVPWIAYAVRSWRWQQAAFILPMSYLLIYFRYLPESPRWLIFHDRHEEALTLFKKASAVNRTTLPPDDVLFTAMNNIRNRERAKKMEVGTKEEEDNGVRGKVMGVLKKMFELILSPEMRMRAIIVYFLWAAAATVYYGVSMNSYNLSTDMYMYYFLSGLLEVPAYLFLWATVGNLGRRKTLAFLFFFCGASISVLTALMMTMKEVPSGVKLFLSLSGKMAITAVFELVWFFTTELFPTKYRSRATGEASMFCRVGSFSSPYINDLLGEVIVWGPSALFSLMSLLAALFGLLLPETTNKNLTQGEDIEEDTNTTKYKTSNA